MAEPDGTPVVGKRHYRHCPDGDCGAQFNPRNDRQEQMLLAKTRPEGTAPVTNTPPASEVAQPSAVVLTAEALAPVHVPQKTKLVFGVRVPA